MGHDATIGEVTPLASRLSASVAQPRFATTVIAAVAASALVLASIGLYGLLSYTVSQRRRELGVRAALGAARANLVRMVLLEGLVLTSSGLAVGLVVAALLTRLMAGLLFGVTPLDAIAYAGAAATLLLVATAASLIPAFGAAATDPGLVLRGE